LVQTVRIHLQARLKIRPAARVPEGKIDEPSTPIRSDVRGERPVSRRSRVAGRRMRSVQAIQRQARLTVGGKTVRVSPAD
jgi:hypothetical protein